MRTLISLRAFMRALTVLLWLCASCEMAAANCPVPALKAKNGDQIADWYGSYVEPFRAGGARPGKEQIESLVDELGAFHRRSVGDSLVFESFVQAIVASYAQARDFKGLDTAAAEKIYKSGNGERLDFSLLCIDTRAGKSADDTFSVTLFGVSSDNCRHVGLRGLVFTDTLINGAANGECRPDQAYFKRLFFPVSAGTNTISFLCRKDNNGCVRQ